MENNLKDNISSSNSDNNNNNNNLIDSKKRLGDNSLYNEHDISLRKRLRDDSTTDNNNNNNNNPATSITSTSDNSDLILSSTISHAINPHHMLVHHPHPHHIIEQSAEEIQVESNIEPGYKTGPWVYEEDERLIQAVGVFKKPDGNVNWSEVTRFITDRSQKQCYVRWNTLLKYRGMGTRRGAWTPEEDSRLTEAVARHERKGGGIYWGKVSEEMGGDRTYQQCLKRWKQVLQHVGSGARTCAWTEQEDARLVEAMGLYDGQGKGGGVDWAKVSEYLGGQRAPTQCYKRWHDALKQRRKSLLGEDWSLEEDYGIIQAVTIYAGEGLGGGVDWNAVSDYIQGTKSAKQCNKRWNRVLKIREGVEGRIRTDPWEPEEERLLYIGVEACRVSSDSNINIQYDIPNNSIEQSNSIDTSNQQLDPNSSSSTITSTNNITPNNNNNINTSTTTNTTSTSNTTNPTDISISQTHYPSDMSTIYQDQQLQQYHIGQRYNDLPSAQHISYHHLYPSQNDLAPGEIHLRSVDWVRVSSEYLGGQRTPRQCEKRFEGLQRQKFRESHYDSNYQDHIDSNSVIDTSIVEDDNDENRRNSSISNLSTIIYPHDNNDNNMNNNIDSNNNTPSRDDRRNSTGSVSSYYRHRGRAIKTGPWLPEEDERLIEAVALYEGQGRGGAVDWGKVCEYMGSERTYDQCRVRWNGVLKVFKNRGTVVKTGPWAKVEDEKLVEAVGIFEGQGKGGGVDWTKVSEYLHGERTPNQCHTRWNSVLKHRGLSMKTTPWTDIEDIKLTEAVGMYDGIGRGGTVDWSKVSEHMGGDRSSYQHRMRWHSVLKHRVAGISSRPTNKKDIVVEPWNEREIDLLLNAIEVCAKENPVENPDITEDSEYSLHNVHQIDSSNSNNNSNNNNNQYTHHHHIQQQQQQQQNHDSNNNNSNNNVVVDKEAYDVFTGPVSASAQSGALIAHTINWIAVSNRLAEEYSLIGGVGIKRSPLQCLYMWRQVMNGRMKLSVQNPSDISTVELDDTRMVPGNSFAVTRNSPWTDMEDEKLTEAVGVYDGQGRGGGVDWAKVCDFMGSVRTYNQCRHRWHNVIKHRGVNHEDMNSRMSNGGDESFTNYGQTQDSADVSGDLSHNQDWNSHQQLALHQLMEQQHQQHHHHQQQQQQNLPQQQGDGEEDSNLYQSLHKYGV